MFLKTFYVIPNSIFFLKIAKFYTWFHHPGRYCTKLFCTKFLSVTTYQSSLYKLMKTVNNGLRPVDHIKLIVKLHTTNQECSPKLVKDRAQKKMLTYALDNGQLLILFVVFVIASYISWRRIWISFWAFLCTRVSKKK